MNTKRMFIALIIAAMTTMTAIAQIREDAIALGNNAVKPTGSWIGTVTAGPGGPPPFRVLMNFTADGNFIGSGDGDSFSGGSPQHGVWEEVRSNPKNTTRKFAVTFLQLFYAPDSSPTGLVKVRQTVILNRSGNSWEGPAIVDIFAPDGTLVFSGTATATATRIQSEPLP